MPEVTYGAADYGQYVWGQGNQQHSGPDGNVIQPINDPTKYAGGETSLAKAAQLSEAGLAMMSKLNATPPAVVYSSTNATPYMAGGKRRGRLQKGAGIITDIAVPAVLLTINHLYKRTKRNTKRTKRTKRNTKRSRK
jgi:hypothetical protein